MKIVRWLVKIAVGTVLVTTLTIFTTWYVVNMAVEDIFRQFNLPAMGKKVQFSEFAARMAAELNIVKPREGGEQANATPKPTPTPAPSQGASPSPTSVGTIGGVQPSGSGANSATGASNQAEEDAVAVMGRAQTDADAQKKDIVISTEDFAKKKDALSSDDKMKIFSLIYSKLPQSEVQHFSAILEDGITADELKEVDQTLKKYLNEQEYKQLMDIINKY
ncbi:hypothetical protein [Paenibacillus aestuarii]|uniref:Spore coat protein n=1 Tax=Paenibacillus aestuarii TaxID=516965 RepID=A0ABW0KD25_9BACL|nr:hypothetical protein [Paenibacillus aestuarii]